MSQGSPGSNEAMSVHDHSNSGFSSSSSSSSSTHKSSLRRRVRQLEDMLEDTTQDLWEANEVLGPNL